MTTANRPIAPKISIVTVVRNGGQFIADTIQSVVNQDYPNREYIIIDGGSTDETLDIIRSFGEAINHWISEPDQGIADAFNKGISLSTGEYIQFLNSDDALADSKVISAMVARIAESDFPALIYGDCDVLDRESGAQLYRARIEFSPRRLKLGQMLPHPGMFVQRNCFRKYGLFDTGYKIGMDYEWLLRCAFTERVVHVPVVVTCVRTGGISTQNRKRVVNEIILAMRKNSLITSRWGEFKMRGYFMLRSLARIVLDSIGLNRKQQSR